MQLARRLVLGLSAAALLTAGPSVAQASFSVNYVVSAGGDNNAALNGLSARGIWSVSGTQLSIQLINNSTGVPAGFDSADSLLTSVGFTLPNNLIILGNGPTAVIAPGSSGFGAWAGRTASSSVADNYAFTNTFGGDLFDTGESLASRQVISTSQGSVGGGSATRFAPGPALNGPSGGMSAQPPLVSTGGLFGVGNSIIFTVNLSGSITQAQLRQIANASSVECGSDARYLKIPAPGASALLGLGGLLAARRRRTA